MTSVNQNKVRCGEIILGVYVVQLNNKLGVAVFKTNLSFLASQKENPERNCPVPTSALRMFT